jgi:hypothetical protein
MVDWKVAESDGLKAVYWVALMVVNWVVMMAVCLVAYSVALKDVL